MDNKWQELYDAAKQVLKHEMFLKLLRQAEFPQWLEKSDKGEN